MNELVLKAKTREVTGKEISRKIRRQGMIPAILYGPSTKPIPLITSPQAIERILRLKKVTSFLDLEIEGNPPRKEKVIIKDIDLHPVTSKILHVDFYQISMDKEITVEVPIVLKGRPKGVEKGGILEQNKRVLAISCLPHLVPESIEVDVSGLEAGDSIHIKDISLRDGIKIVENPQIPIATVVVAEKEEGEAEES